MIAKLSGTLDSVGVDNAVIDVGGIGYLVGLSTRTLDAIGVPGGAVTLHTEMLVAEDSIRLVGFGTARERDWFRLLTSVQGVGAKVALAILSVLPPDALATAIARDDRAAIGRASGVGPKLAQRIANELRDRTGAVGGSTIPAALAGAAGADGSAGIVAEAASALVNLGFRPGEAASAVAAAADGLGGEATLDALVRAALRKAAR